MADQIINTNKLVDKTSLFELARGLNEKNKKYVDNKVSELVNSAPEALDTLNELATALGNDANFATTVTNSLANKAEKDHNHVDIYAPIESPNFTTAISMGRKADTVIGGHSIALGTEVEANENNSFAEGYNTIANGDNQHVQGKYNIKDTKNRYSHIVGNGTESLRSNIHTLDWNGNAWFQGNVYVGGNNQDDGKILITKEYVDSPKDSIVLKDQSSDDSYALQINNGVLTTVLLPYSAEILTMPNKLNYEAGECFDPTGMEISLLYSDGTTSVANNIENMTYSENYLTEDSSVTVGYYAKGITLTTSVDVTVNPFDAENILIDFEYVENDDGTYTITAWKGTLNGEPSTEMVIPNSPLIIL